MHKTWFPEQPLKHYEKFLHNLILTFWYWFGCVEMFASRASSENTEHLTFWSLIPRIWESLKKKQIWKCNVCTCVSKFFKQLCSYVWGCDCCWLSSLYKKGLLLVLQLFPLSKTNIFKSQFKLEKTKGSWLTIFVVKRCYIHIFHFYITHTSKQDFLKYWPQAKILPKGIIQGPKNLAGGGGGRLSNQMGNENYFK